MTSLKLLSIIFEMSQKILLSIDPYAFDSLLSQQHKIIKIEILQLGEYYLRIENKSLSLINHDLRINDCHCQLRGPLNAYLDIIFKYKRFVPGQGIHISGQTAVAQALFESFQNLDPDWAGQFEKRIPKPLVALGGHFMTKYKQAYQSWQQARKEDVRLYLQNEVNVLVANSAFQQFCQELHTLQNRIAHLDLRQQALSIPLGPSVAGPQ